jgi:site-specific DNA-cytosine methylase
MRRGRKPGVVVELFAGAGGLGEGLAMAGFNCVAGVEFDPEVSVVV